MIKDEDYKKYMEIYGWTDEEEFDFFLSEYPLEIQEQFIEEELGKKGGEYVN